MHGSLNDQSLIYLQIAQMLEDDILRGVYREEEQVPSTNELAREYNINPATAAKGINLLVAEGVLYNRKSAARPWARSMCCPFCGRQSLWALARKNFWRW